MSTAQTFRALRKQTGLTAGAFDEAIGASVKYTSAVERGAARPSPEMARCIVWKLAELGVDVDAEFAYELAFMPTPGIIESLEARMTPKSKSGRASAKKHKPALARTGT